MALHFYLLKVSDITRETPEAVSVTFDIPSDLKDIFRFKHGQYITVKVPVDGEENRRAYSISSSPIEEKIRIGVKKVEGGTVSVFMNDELKVGDFIEVMPPMGNFTIDLDPSHRKEYVFFGAGSGITPLLSIMKSILFTEKESKIKLLYANQYTHTIIYHEELEELSREYGDRFELTHILSRDEAWEGLKGRITGEICKDYVDEYLTCSPPEAEYFLCGPRDMMKDLTETLLKLGVDTKSIHKESFTSALPDEVFKAETVGKSSAANGDDGILKTREITIILYGEEHQIEVDEDETVLTAAMTKGVDPPFSCQIGACSTCRARLKSGKVEMEAHDALMESEIEEGFILTCTAHPMSDDVVIDYDDNF